MYGVQRVPAFQGGRYACRSPQNAKRADGGSAHSPAAGLGHGPRSGGRFVAPTGSDAANDCLSSLGPRRTIAYAVTQAASGDTIKVAGATYRGNVTVDFSINADHCDIGDRVTNYGTFNDLGGNIDVDPLLVSRTDFHLGVGSPAIDTGTCAGAPATDFEGDPRPTGAGCDIGADEFVP